MDKLFSVGKEFLEDQNQDKQGSNSQGGGFFDRDDDDDFRTAKQEASQRAGSSGNSELFHSIISSIGQKQGKLADEDIDEQDAINKYKKSYVDKDEDEENEKSLGTAAAMHALKLFNNGETGDKQGKGAFLGLALSEASKLFEDKASAGKVTSGTSKESVVQQAGEVAMKMYLKSQGQQQGGILGFASKFMN
ncbi:hypothetical protein V2G26_011635 [Clonostachys chloroleuca]